ncbi:hypothetical protein RNAN_2919 [Rheinheimera nanhaiensis E407-8]|uniref:Uncharacterized protein n=1 Tax=Rheinheimera nanhaiensis E407-8 TaxID=562729 RepID=I1E0S8_9GAMM|nr:hypothetical protein RNAN_2919 [Rheinheimera nanhaiensis E407-8]
MRFAAVLSCVCFQTSMVTKQGASIASFVAMQSNGFGACLV